MTTYQVASRAIPKAFPDITKSEAEELINNSEIHAYPPGTVLCREGAFEDTFYISLEGEAEVTKVINSSEVRLLKTLGTGSFFGEMALIHDEPRTASVTSKTHIVVLELKKDAFDRILENSTTIAMTMVREISNRLRANDEKAVADMRVRASELAEAYQKLAEQEYTRREFLSNIAHELRTPLMTAGGFLQALQMKIIPSDSLDETIEIVARNVQQIATLVNDILFLQEIDIVLPDFKPVDLRKLTENITEKYQFKAKDYNVKLHLEMDEELPFISGDAKSLERALECLIDNAIKFSPGGGDVNIRLFAEGKFISLSVQDYGIGISKERLSRIFDRFYHQEEKDGNLFSGIGIGLAITRQVIKQHKGKFNVESKEGVGSTFKMSLLAKKAPEEKED